MPQLAIAVICGAGLAYYGNDLADSCWSAMAPLVLLLAVLRPRQRWLLVVVAVYLWSCALLAWHLGDRLTDAYDNRITAVTGEVVDLPQRGPGLTRFYLRPDWIEGYPGRLPGLIRLNWYSDHAAPAAGERWRLEVKLRQPRAALNPGQFDFEAWQFGRGIDAVGYVRLGAENRRLAGSPALAVDAWRARLAAAIAQRCADCEQVGLIRALVLGDRSGVSAATRSLLVTTSTAHLLAISGLHVGLVAGLVLILGRRCWLTVLARWGLQRERLAVLIGFAAACGYAALAGFSLPTVRAVLMLAVLGLGVWRRERTSLLQSVALAAILIVVLDPRATGSASFWLSASAVLVIGFALFGRAREAGWRRLLRLQCYFALLQLPLGIMIFDQVSTSGIAANLVAVPVIGTLVLPAILLACLLAAIGEQPSAALFHLADHVLGRLLDYLLWLEAVGPGVQPAGALPGLLCLLLLLALIALLTPLSRGAKVFALLLLSGLLAWRPSAPGQGEFVATVFDVGLGTSVLIRTRHHSLVYDLGPGRDAQSNSAERTLLPALKHYAAGKPDLIVVSHVDQDHSGGLHSYAMRHLAPGRLLSGTPEELRRRYDLGFPVADCHAHRGWRWDDVKFSFVSPSRPSPAGGSNNRSCVLRVDGHQRLLLPGDIETARERQLQAAAPEQLDAEVLIAPHHGSATSSSAAFIAAVTPAYVVHTVSRANRWNFPDAAVLARYRAAGSRQLRSDMSGAIEIRSAASGLSLKALREPPRRLWRRW